MGHTGAMRTAHSDASSRMEWYASKESPRHVVSAADKVALYAIYISLKISIDVSN